MNDPTAVGSQRRIQALMARSWSAEAIGEASGISTDDVRTALEHPAAISHEVASGIAQAYDALWDAQPPRAPAAGPLLQAAALASTANASTAAAPAAVACAGDGRAGARILVMARPRLRVNQSVRACSSFHINGYIADKDRCPLRPYWVFGRMARAAARATARGALYADNGPARSHLTRGPDSLRLASLRCHGAG
jgi:hypothetical protein